MSEVKFPTPAEVLKIASSYRDDLMLDVATPDD